MVTTEIDYAQSSGAIVIGKMAHSYNNNSNYFPMNGEIKNAKVFNRALTPEEVKIEYNTMFANKMQIHDSGTLYVKNYEEY